MRRATFAALLLAAACGGGGGGGGERAVTDAEADVLASVLTENLAAEGATFTVELVSEGAAVRIEGAVDWVGHAGRATIEVGDAPPYDVLWTSDAVLQALPGLAERVPGAEWVVHPADPAGSRLDTLAAVLVGLAATTPDNPVNLLQRDDVAYVGDDELDGAPVDGFRSGTLVLWIGEDDGRLHRLEAPLAFADDGAVIDLRDWGPVRVELPDPSATVEAADVPAVYAELTSVGTL